MLQALCLLLKRDPATNFKAKGNALVTVLACNLLYTAYLDEDHWPQQLVEVSWCLVGMNWLSCKKELWSVN